MLWQQKKWARITVIVIQGLGVFASILFFVLRVLGSRHIHLATSTVGYDLGGLAAIILGAAISAYIIYWLVYNGEHFLAKEAR